jgi:DNA invertase Pin-like site-specific DNA recombinase
MTYTYTRCSTDKQDNSLEYQESILLPFLNRKGITEYISLIDNDTSGGKPILKRASGSKLADLQKGDAVVFCKLDRASREVANGSYLFKKWFKMGVDIYFLNISQEPINMNDATMKFMVHVSLAAAEMEKDNASERTVGVLKHKKETKKVYASACYGWENEYTEKNAKGEWINGKIVPNPKEQAVIRDIKEYKRLNYSLNWIANKLNLDEIPSKKGGKWSAKTIKDVLENSLNQ